MKQIKIEQLLPLLKSGWVAYDKRGEWHWFRLKPKKYSISGVWIGKAWSSCDFYQFNIAPFDGDWKDSLIKCGESAIIKKHKEEE
jgi:hypothetical protein